MFRLVNVVAVASVLTAAALPARGQAPDKAAVQIVAAAPQVEFSAPPKYEPGPPMGGPVTGAAQEPLLVPLPPGVWAAISGLAGLAVLAVWRKHHLREE